MHVPDLTYHIPCLINQHLQGNGMRPCYKATPKFLCGWGWGDLALHSGSYSTVHAHTVQCMLCDYNRFVCT